MELSSFVFDNWHFENNGVDMMKTQKFFMRGVIGFALLIGVSGCMNMPTPPEQITGSYTSGLKYKDFSCQELAAEQNSLVRRKNQLVVAQQQRIETSNVQAFWWGYGQGDGLEASELATVKGELEAVRTALDSKDCY